VPGYGDQARVALKGPVCLAGDLPGWAGLVACQGGRVVNLTLSGVVTGGVLPTDLDRLPRLKAVACEDCSLKGGTFRDSAEMPEQVT
jgi:hypothetical protein